MRIGLFLSVIALAVCVIALLPAQSNRPTYHVSGQGLPASVASPSTIEGTTLSASNTVSIIVLANTDSSDHTVTVQDCQTTPFVLFNAYTISAHTTWIVPLNGTRFTGCLKWAASDAKVMGTIVGEM